MKKIYLLVLASCLSFIGYGQTNVALTATAAQSGGGTGAPPSGYGAANYNDNVIATGPSCAEVNTPWGWVSTNGSITYTWSSATTFNKIVFYKSNRPMTTCTI